ncbi:MAG: PaaI family thioesterase [Actinomycetota bacterium]
MNETVVIDHRFCGPPDSANGGYACGVVAAPAGNPAVVTLRLPPPLDIPLRLERGHDRVRTLDGDTLLAEASAAERVDLEVPAPISFDDAKTASEGSWIRSTPERHAFPTCFVCGPDRQPGDGLRVFVGPVSERAGLHAASWVPDASIEADGTVPPVFVWSVLDCAGGIGADFSNEDPHVLGRMTADVRRPVAVGERCVAVGWRIGVEGRKLDAGSVIFDAAGDVIGAARATWIRLKE